MGKVCTWCGVLKERDDFYYDSKKSDRRYSHCKACHRKSVTQWRKEHPEKYKLGTINGRLEYKYGITLEQKMEMLKQQGGVCGICKSPDPGVKYGWHTDHDHATGKIRGVLCHRCNLRLDWAIHNKEAIINYLKGENDDTK